MKARRLIFEWFAAAVAVLPAMAASTRYAITPGLVAATMNRAGIQISADQVTLMAGVVATTPAPILKVSSVERLDNQRVLARLECKHSEECLPFFVSLGAGRPSNAQGAPISPDLLSAGLATAAKTVVKKGSAVRLMLEGNHIHIGLSVVCLESGALGQTIRVTDKSHRMVYTAEVVNGGLVKGRLE